MNSIHGKKFVDLILFFFIFFSFEIFSALRERIQITRAAMRNRQQKKHICFLELYGIIYPLNENGLRIDEERPSKKDKRKYFQKDLEEKQKRVLKALNGSNSEIQKPIMFENIEIPLLSTKDDEDLIFGENLPQVETFDVDIESSFTILDEIENSSTKF